jgi:hypothetical protein
VGVEPTASLVLSRGGLPVAYRAIFSCQYPEQESNLQTSGFKPDRSAVGVPGRDRVVPDGIEPSFPGCEPGVVAVGPRDCAIEWTHRELHPDLRHATPASSCSRDESDSRAKVRSKHAPKDLNPDQLGWNQPCCRLHQGRVFVSGSCGGRNRTFVTTVQSRLVRASTGPTAVFGSINVIAVFSSGGRNRTYGLLVQSQASLPTATTPECFSLLSSRGTGGTRTRALVLNRHLLCR